MITTINTDASYSSHDGSGGYAFRVINNTTNVVKFGKFKTDVGGSTDAEFYCVCNALAFFQKMKARYKEGTKRIVVNCDNKPVVEMFSTELPLKAKKFRLAKEKALAYYTENRIKISFRYVKAHTKDGKNTPREFVNNRIDEIAKIARKS